MLDRVLFWSLLAFVPLVSIAVSPWQFDAVDLTKATILWSGTVFLFAVWIVKAILSDKVTIRKTRLDLVILIFLGIFALATVLSIHFPTSFYGKYGRYEGLVTYLAYVSLFFFSSQTFFNYERIKMLAMFMIGSAVIVSCYGLAQYIGYDFVTWTGGTFESQRSFSTFGNPLALAGFLVTVAPIAAAFALMSPDKKLKGKWVRTGAVLLILIVVWLTFSRGAWVALVTGFVALVFLLKRSLIEPKWIVLIGIVLLVSFLLVVGLTARSATSTTNILARARSALVPTEGSLATRLEIWKSAVRIIRRWPLLGSGPDTFGFRFSRFQTLRYIRLQDRPATADNAHSYPLQLASTIGIPGMAAFLALFLAILQASIQQIRKGADSQLGVLSSGFVAGTLGYLTHLLFAISSVGSTALVWMVAGALVAQDDTTGALRVKWDKKTLSLRLAIVGVALIMGIGALSLAVRPYLADFHFSKGEALASLGSWEEATGEFERAVRLNPANDRYKAEFGLMYFTWGQAMENNPGLFDQAIRYVEGAKRSSPLMVDHYHILAFIYRYMGRNIERKFYNSAETELKTALRLEPNSPRERGMLASVYLGQGKMEQALAELRKAKAIKPNYPPVYLYLGTAYETKGELDKAREAYEMALKINPYYEEASDALKELINKRGKR